MIRVLLVDDHKLVREGFAALLASSNGIEIVGEAVDGESAVEQAKALLPDVVLMDVLMPGIGGLEATKRILRSAPETKVIGLTACVDGPLPSRLLQAGARGFLSKGATHEELVSAIRKVQSGQRYLTQSVAQDLALRSVSPDDTSYGPFDALSERELQVTMMVVNGEKVSYISDKLCLSPKTVNTYRYRIFEKLEVSNDVELTRLAMRHQLLTDA